MTIGTPENIIRRYKSALSRISGGVCRSASTGLAAICPAAVRNTALTAESTAAPPTTWRRFSVFCAPNSCAQHHPVEPVRRSQGRQGLHAQSLSHHHGIHDGIKLLKNIADHQRKGKCNNQGQWLAPGHVLNPCHIFFLFFFSFSFAFFSLLYPIAKSRSGTFRRDFLCCFSRSACHYLLAGFPPLFFCCYRS